MPKRYSRNEIILFLCVCGNLINLRETILTSSLKVLEIDLIHNARHLCTRSRIDWIKAMSRGISGGEQVIKFANTSDRGQVYLYYQNKMTIHSHSKCTCARFTSLLFAMRTSTVASEYKKVTMITSTHILTSSSLK